MVRATDAERGSIICSHVGCGGVNLLQTGCEYDEALVQGLPEFGRLTYVGQPTVYYSLQYGVNVIGTADSCTVQVERINHNGRCFISRRHCTLTVTFDTWSGQLRYQLEDGATDAYSVRQYSLNGTLLDGKPMQKTEIIDMNDGSTLTLGGADQFRLTHYNLPPAMLDTYKVELAFNPDRTQ